MRIKMSRIINLITNNLQEEAHDQKAKDYQKKKIKKLTVYSALWSYHMVFYFHKTKCNKES